MRHLLPDDHRPAYLRIADDLRHRIRAGDFDDYGFPGLRDLADQYDYGIDTIRKAVAQLVADKLLVRARGQAYRIADTPPVTVVAAAPGTSITARRATARDAHVHGVAEGELVLVVSGGGEEWLYPAVSTVIRPRA